MKGTDTESPSVSGQLPDANPVQACAEKPDRSRTAWLPWLLGFALLAAVVGAAAHLSEGREFLSLVERAEPRWFALAILLQAAVYLSLAWVWSAAGRRSGVVFSLAEGYKLSLARVFVNQAFPSLGLAGILLAEIALERRGVPRSGAMAGVVVNTVSYYIAYALAFGVALVILSAGGWSIAWELSAVVLFALFGAGLTWALLSFSWVSARPVARFPFLQRLLSYIQNADPRMTRSLSFLSAATAAQLAVVLMDAATLWALLRAVGASISPFGAFASFMLSTLARTVGFMPGGLGTFEAASLVTLKMAGAGLPEALAATLLFRGLNFWLPMAPGYWFSRKVGKQGGVP